MVSHCNRGRTCSIHLLFLLLASITPAIADDVAKFELLKNALSQFSTPAAPTVQVKIINSLEPIKVQVIQPVMATDPADLPYFGYGKERTFELVTFPVVHPIKLLNKVTFPGRHPLLFVKKSGEVIAPYEQGLNSLTAVKNLFSPVP